jgi:hypothetical protein
MQCQVPRGGNTGSGCTGDCDANGTVRQDLWKYSTLTILIEETSDCPLKSFFTVTCYYLLWLRPKLSPHNLSLVCEDRNTAECPCLSLALWGPANDAVVVEHLVSPSKVDYSPKGPPAENGFPKYRLLILSVFLAYATSALMNTQWLLNQYHSCETCNEALHLFTETHITSSFPPIAPSSG